MKLDDNSIALYLNEIAQTDGQRCGIFRHVDRVDINKEYANEQIVNIITKHQNSFFPTKRAFKNKRNNLVGTSKMVTEGTETQLKKQKRMMITSHRGKFLKRNDNRNI